MTSPHNNSELANPIRSRGRRILLATVSVALLLTVIIFLSVGHWLVSEDQLEQAQAIAVLSGRMPLRAIEAAKLYREGYAAKVWLTRSAEPAQSLEPMGISFVGEDFYNTRVLIHEGVPSDAIRVLDPPIVNTADEITAISDALRGEQGQRVILVTNKVHTRRTRILWRKLAAGKGKAIVRGVSDDPFNASRWWKNTTDALDVVREVLGILNAWAGLPLRPGA